MDEKTLKYMESRVAESNKILAAIAYRKKRIDILMDCESVVKTDFVTNKHGSYFETVIVSKNNEIITFDFHAEIHAKAIELLKAEIVLLEEMLEKI